jgi:carboxypeptidase C (cathepsin A)
MQKHEQMIQKLARFSGLSPDYVRRTDLRVNEFRFFKELLRDEQRTVGRIDSRFKGIDRDSAGEVPEFDPSIANIVGSYSATFYSYVRDELKFESDLPYENCDRARPWSVEHQNQYVNVAETLRQAMTINPYLKVFIASGYFDLATPYLATDYTFNQLGLDESLRKNIRIGYYEAGHMMYIHIPSLQKMKTELDNFIRWAVPFEL